MKISTTKILLIGLGIVGFIAGWFLFFSNNKIEVKRGEAMLEGMNFPESDLSGIKCEKAKVRPLAVMLASDPETRPLSGIGEADLVFEMPVTDGGVTRMMAVFQCDWPEEIGSIRSSRSDFIPLVQGLGAVYAHWGGEKEALSELNRGVVDNIDAMKYDGTIYYRKKGAKPPHNGFTNPELINKAIVSLEYGLSKSLSSYSHQNSKSSGDIQPPTIYKDEFQIAWEYDQASNSYRRKRGGKEEIDKNTSKQVEAKNIVLMKTTWSPVSKDYIRVKTVGSGEATFYQNGQEIKGFWKKITAKEKLYFYDAEGGELKFTPGTTWVEIVTD
ncbi:MAG: DUF3048 domain-containing protein [Candidatus Yanofskybacteria bacterium]|nr:DUF3048 domain-containing protein [Candidatus Yanofskybacteria bacterium]